MRVFSGKEVCDILILHGFEQVRQKGSHVIMQKRTPNSTVTVPIPLHKELKVGTLRSIIRQTGVDKKEFD